MKWGLEHGFLYAYPQELAQYQGRQRFAVLLADYFYVTQKFAKAGEVADRLVKGDCGELGEGARQYPRFLSATSTYWMRGAEAAAAEYLKMVQEVPSLKGKDVSFTIDRAAYSAGNTGLTSSTEVGRKKAMDLLQELAFSGRENEFVFKARIAYGVALIESGKREEGKNILESFPDSAGEYRAIAQEYVRGYAETKDSSRTSSGK